MDWVDDPGTTVNITATALEDLRGVWRLLRGLGRGRIPIGGLRRDVARPQRPAPLPGVPAGLLGQLLRFATVGVVSTLAYFLLYVVLRPVFGAQAANLSALVLTAVANTSANRLFTFGVRGRQGMLGHHATGLLAFLVALGLTSGSLAALHAWAPGVDRWVEIAVLAVANAAATGLRFLALRLAIARRA